MKRPDLTPEQIEEVKQDLAANKKRGQICKERGYTYVQLQRALGFTHKKGPRKQRIEQTAEAVN